MLSLNDPLVDSVPVPPRPRPRQELILILRERTARVPATYLLLALNVAVYAALAAATGSFTQFSAAELVKWGADYGPRTTNGE